MLMKTWKQMMLLQISGDDNTNLYLLEEFNKSLDETSDKTFDISDFFPDISKPQW